MTARMFRLVCVCIVGGVLVHGAGGSRAQERLPVPSAEAEQKVLELVREVYGEAWAEAKTSARRKALADELFEKAAESRSDVPTHFVLLRLSRDIAAMGGEVGVAFRAIDEAAARFRIDSLAWKSDALLRAAKAASAAEQRKAVAEHARPVIEQAVEADAFDVARQVYEAGAAAARSAEEWSLAREMVAHYRENVEPLAAAYAATESALNTLDANPIDPDANLAAGRYYGFHRGAWDRGLPMLALGSDETLKALARKELEGPKNTKEQVALGDGWWDLAPGLDEALRHQVQARAAHWYARAQPRLTGLDRGRIDRRLSEVAQAAAEAETAAQTPDKPKRPVKPKPDMYAFINEAAIREHWDIEGQWRIEAEGIRLYGQESQLRFRGSIRGNVDIRIAYQVSRYYELGVTLFGETLTFSSTGRVAAIVRKDDALHYATPGRAPVAVTVKQAHADVDSDIVLGLATRWRTNESVLIQGVAILAEE